MSVFNQDDGNEQPDKRPSPFRKKGHIHLTQPGIERLLLSINLPKAADPGEVTSNVLKETGHEILGVLTYIFHMFQLSYEEGAIPADWSSAHISAMYKMKGNKSTLVNYKPLSLTYILCKIMEHMVFSHIGCHLDEQNKFCISTSMDSGSSSHVTLSSSAALTTEPRPSI